ncbi:thiol peroxidase [Fructilactobacillus hinvesii]|uniref:Thiol peroxidase n=1 Tax=Fructilactobacillus hinvesii TaxID=2940300 RepID=A0ABY5BS39_9LACO|nr:thiol peroxidase [Fructilactobacillus hinvesii]USS87689.1 thiol peroxidase [Fructilactobacillus hinvesii]
MKVKLMDQTVELVGNPPVVGEQFPTFTVQDDQEQSVTLQDLLGKPLVICAVPDLNTDVCSMETKKFNQQADQFPAARFVTVSNNSIAEQTDWCAAKGVKNLAVLSDEEGDFGQATGLYIPSFKHLARAVFVLDATGKITYAEVLAQIAAEPDYKQALAALQELL